MNTTDIMNIALELAGFGKEQKGNLIVTGHYPSDALGINPPIEELERRGVEVTPCNGL